MNTRDYLFANPTEAINMELHNSVLNNTECERQLDYLSNSAMIIPYMDSTAKLPSGILTLNMVEFGDFFACLSIDKTMDGINFLGKYCNVIVPLVQNISRVETPGFNMMMMTRLAMGSQIERWSNIMDEALHSEKLQSLISNPIVGIPNLRLGICLPRPCRTRQFINYFKPKYFPDLTYVEGFCRLPNDKPYFTADYVAMGFMAIVFLMTALSTGYDLYQTFIKKSKPTNRLLTSFSVYTNASRFITFNKTKNALECVDGIRALSMFWVIVGHSYIMRFYTPTHNVTGVLEWIPLVSSSWINSAPIVVDTFFLLSGIFCIYSIPKKVGATLFLKNLHIFYLYRLLRLLPLLGTVVLFQTSVFNWLTDGPDWERMAYATVVCKKRWWAALLHVQNYVTPTAICLFQSWYLTVDTQLYILSPLVLIFLFGSRKLAWSVLSITLLAALVTVTYYAFTYDIPIAIINVWMLKMPKTFVRKFYTHTPARAAPFVIGIMYGYILKAYRGKTIQMQKKYIFLFWIVAMLAMTFCIFAPNKTIYDNYEPHFFDHFLSSYMRSMWAVSVGWMILACTHGFGGPFNWFLSHSIWKLPSRMSYAVYLIHLPLIMIRNGGMIKSEYFTDLETLYSAASYALLSMLVAFALCVVIDAPCNTLQKAVFAPSRAAKKKNEANVEENDNKTRL